MAHTTAEIRDQFIDFFSSRGHQILPSSPLIPPSDPTLMFTNAGMVQFKDVFTGLKTRPGPRAASVQKCIRISGKHNDLANVGRTSRHHTFFEMLGNFSFGDYFKEEACRFGWDLLTSGFGLATERLWVTVFEGDETAPADEEAATIWRDVVGVPEARIVRCSAADNFWSMGDVGPCGPCSEIHFDRGDAFGPPEIDNGERFFELWNLVFMQFKVDEPGGALTPLPSKCIDTGAGLERIASVLQGVESNYDTDGFSPLVQRAAELSGKAYGESGDRDVSMRVIADHARMTAFLIAEGVFPEKTGREYVLRRVMRRAIRHAHRLGIDDLFLHHMADKVVDVMGDAYPELGDHRDLIDRICQQEEERFRATLGRGLTLLEETTTWATGPAGQRVLPGEVAFDLTATYGFPKDLIQVIGDEDGFVIDEGGYAKAQALHKTASGSGKIGEAAVSPVYVELSNALESTVFTGYERRDGTAQVLAIVRDEKTVEATTAGQAAAVILDRSPFYGEAGGQVGDKGTITARDGLLEVAETKRPTAGLLVHRGTVVRGQIRVGDEVALVVDDAAREATQRHHTATHLLHMALRQILGPHATQKGSLVSPERLRFDFTHYEPVGVAALGEIERRVAGKILENSPVETEELSYDDARGRGAVALFGENYGDVVRMVTASAESVELCGGTHVSRTGDIGAFFITNETGIAAGVRRIEAVAGLEALSWVGERRKKLEQVSALLRSAPEAIVPRVEAMLGRERELNREVADLKRKLAAGGQDLLVSLRKVGGIDVVGVKVQVGEPAALRDTADTVRNKIGSGVVCLGGENNGKAALIVAVTKDLNDRLSAGKLIKEVAAVVGGRGGGRPDFAQAGGPMVEKLDEAVEEIYNAVAAALKV